MRRFRFAFVALLPFAGAAACDRGSGRASDPNVEVRDSAGIRIVESRAPVWAEGEGWTIDAEPVLQIGAVEGDDPHLFSSVWSATRRGDGVIAVSERSANEIRLFGPDGAHLRTIGRSGEGPGEFGEGPIVVWAHPDTLLAWDPEQRRLMWFDDRGLSQREESLAEVLAESAVRAPTQASRAWQLLPDGALVARGTTMELESLRLITANRSVTSLGDYPAPEGVIESGWLVRHTFAPHPYSAVRARPFAAFVSRTGRREVTGFSADGTVTSLLRIESPRIPLTEEMLEGERDRWRERAEQGGRALSTYVDVYNRLTFPDSLPAILDLHVDAIGNLWMGRRVLAGFLRATTFDVLDFEGRWLGTVEVPEDANPIYEIGDDYLLAGWRDGLDVFYVRMYRIVK